MCKSPPEGVGNDFIQQKSEAYLWSLLSQFGSWVLKVAEP